MSYYETKLDSLRLSTREQAGLRRAQKGLGDRTRLFKDEEADPNKLVTTRGLIPSRDRKEETSQPDFLTEFYNELQVSNKSLREQIEEYIRKNESESTQKEPKLNEGSKIQSTADFIASFEQTKPQKTYKAYWDKKQYSIGFGTKAKSKDEVITHEEAVSRLNEATKKAQKDVMEFREKFNYNWNPDQVKALTSFTFNLGRNNLLKLIEKGTRGTEEIADMILEYNMAGGKVEPGLTKRRKAEYELFSLGSIAD
jgi:GH24 family phage-related lysozyme (muramidase)